MRNPEYSVVIEDLDAYLDTVLPQNRQYIIVGDVHERVDELQGLLLSYGYRIEAGRLIAGDRVRDAKIILAKRLDRQRKKNERNRGVFAC